VTGPLFASLLLPVPLLTFHSFVVRSADKWLTFSGGLCTFV
jgi:hypothetical protein